MWPKTYHTFVPSWQVGWWHISLHPFAPPKVPKVVRSLWLCGSSLHFTTALCISSSSRKADGRCDMHELCRHRIFGKQTWPLERRKHVTQTSMFFSAGMPGSETSWNAWVRTRSLPNVWRRAVREKCPCHFGWEDSLRPVSLCFAFTASPLQDVELVS